MTAGNVTDEFVPLEVCPSDDTTRNVAPAARPTTLNMNDDGDDIDFRSIGPGPDVTDGPSNNNNSSRNVFSERQNVARGLCDASLMAANISQLRAVLDGDPGNRYLIPLLVMIGLSLLLHIVFGLLMIQRWRKERRAEMEHVRDAEKAVGTPMSRASDPKGTKCFCNWCASVEWYDEISIFVMFFVIILNVAIAGLGLTDKQQ